MSADTDKKESKVHLDLGSMTIDALVAAKNGFAQMEARWPGQTPEKHKAFWFAGQTVPDNTDYPDSIAPIGSLYFRYRVTDGAISNCEVYVKRSAGLWSPLGSEILVADVTITSAQLLALNATPQTLVAAPGAGRALIFMGAQLMLDYNSAAYDGIAAGEDLSVKYNNGSGAEVAQIEATGFLDATADAYRYAHPASTAAVTPVANVPLVLHMLVGEIATGNSPLRVRVFYRNVNLDLSNGAA